MIAGHNKQWQYLKNSAASGRLAHGLLFSGEKQLGKKKIAIEFVKFLFCESKNKPCGECRNCRDIEKGSHPDLAQLDSDGGEIQVSALRNLIWKMSLKPYSAPFKAAIINSAHLMNFEAQNCFLKTLEEPKGNIFLILISEYPDLILPTILSRTQKIKFFPIKKELIKEYLVKRGAEDKKAKYFASISLGRPGRAIEVFLNEEKLKSQERFVEDIKKINNSDLALKFKYAKSLAGEIENSPGLKLSDIFEIWLGYFRSIFLDSLAGEKTGEIERAQAIGKTKKSILAIQNINYLVSTTNINTKLALEILLLDI